MAKLTRDEVKKIADLAKISLADEELDKYAEEISNILGFVEQIDEVDTSDVENDSPLADYKGTVLQLDEPVEALSHDDVFLNGEGRSKGDYFVVEQIVNKE